MKDLEKLRDEIDACDREIVKSLERRFNTLKDIISYKKQNDMTILQANRENEVLEKVESYLESKEFSNELREIYVYIMKISKEIQKTR